MKKRVIVGATLVSMLVGGLAGSTVNAEELEESRVYTVWAWDANVEAIQEAAARYNEATGSNIQLDVVTVVNEDSRNKLVTIGETGDYDSLPDFTLMEDTAIAQFADTYPEMFVDLTDYDIPWDDLVASKKALYTVNGSYWAIPMDSGASIAMYRTDYLEEAGYTLDDLTDVTWDRVAEIGADVYEKTGHYLLLDSATSCFIARQMYTSSGEQLFDEEKNPTLDTETMRLVLETVKNLVDSNSLYIAGSWDEYNSCLNDGTAAGVVNGNWVNGNISNAEDQAGLWAVTNMPALDIEGATHMTNSGGASWVLTSKAGEDADEIAAFLSYVLTGEGAQNFWEYLTDFAGYLPTYIPVLESGYTDNINSAFYGETFFSDVAACVNGAPALNSSPYYASALDSLMTAVLNVVDGADIESEVKAAQENIEFIMGIE